MAANNASGAFVGFAGIVLMASLLCAPALGWGGIIAGLTTIYFGLVLTNGADTAAKRRRR